jgi:hypothetical protein
MYPSCHVKPPFDVPIKKIRDEGGTTTIKKVRDEGQPFKKVHDEGGGLKKLRDEAGGPTKKVRDDGKKIRDGEGGLKKLRDDPPVVKGFTDPKGPADPGPIKAAFDPQLPGGIGPVSLPGGLQPFAIATPHHAVLGAMAAGDPTGGTLSSLHRQLLELDAALAAAHARSAQATAEAAGLEEAMASLASVYQDVLDRSGG